MMIRQGNDEVRRRSTRRRGQAGQSLIVAIIVLFLLLFLGGVFIALIANNYKNTGRAVNTTAATGFANSGLQYLDEQLTKSPEGADWRPVPDNLPAPGVGVTDYDPDYFWLKPYDKATGEGGYTRISFGGPTPTSGNVGGRALVRVTYRPTPNDPTSRYIKLESIGRTGTVIANDPTTYGNSQRAGLRRELVAFKSIGITDYVRFITNKDNKPGTATLGAPFPVFDRPLSKAPDSANPIDYLGNPTQRSICSVYAGSIRVNAPLEFYGVNQFTLNPDRNDVIEIAGPITMHNVRPNADGTKPDFDNASNPEQANVTVTVQNGANTSVSRVFPSSSPAFTTGVVGYDNTGVATTIAGVIRDSPTGTETMGLTDTPPVLTSGGTVPAGYVPSPNLRSTPRLTPPVIDNQIGPNGLTRYRALTRNSAPIAPKFSVANPVDPTKVSNDYAGQIGWGSGLYINNGQDVQTNSTNIFGGYSLRGDWLNPSTGKSGTNTYWKGDLSYVPPAVTITLTPRYMILTRSAYAQGRSYFRDNNGNRINESTIIRYTDAGLKAKPAAGIAPQLAPYIYEGYPADNTDVNGKTLGYYQGDYVVYAEGNIRVRGVVGGIDPETRLKFLRHLTLVSGGTIYIDGNLLRDNITPANADADAIAIKGKSSIALLAKDYICVNTTQFLNPSATLYNEESGEFVPVARQIDQNSPSFDFGYSFGSTDANNTPPTYVTDPAGPGLSLFLRHSSGFVDTGGLSGTGATLATGATINLLTIPTPFGGITPYPFAPGTFSLNIPSEKYLLEGFPLDTTGLTLLDPTVNPLGFENLFSLVNDSSGGGKSAYKLTRVAIVPSDIRIEAFLYAQEGSFFIIPGPWFNPNPNDTYEKYISADPTTPSAGPAYRRPEENAINGAPTVDPRYPFYGQPLDIRITFYGTIAENLPAEIGDQGAWEEKWGWVPRYYGSSQLPSATGIPSQIVTPATAIKSIHGHPNNPLFRTGEGIYYDFNPDAIAPYMANGDPIRPNPYQPTDPLPIVPRLPVAPGLLYTGENPVQ